MSARLRRLPSPLALALLGACSFSTGPQLRTDREDLELGDVVCASSKGSPLVIRNTGDERLVLSLRSTLSEILVSPSELGLAPDEARAIQITGTVPPDMLPGATLRGDLEITTNEDGETLHTLPLGLRVTGVTVTAAPTVELGQLLPGSGATRTLELTAAGAGTVTVRLGSAAPFSLPSPSEITLRPGSTGANAPFGTAVHAVPVSYAAAGAPRTVSAALPIEISGEVCGAPPAVSLAAQVSNDVVTFDRAAIDLGTIACAPNGSGLLEITNHGGPSVAYSAALTDPQGIVVQVSSPAGTLASGQTQQIRVYPTTITSGNLPLGEVLANLNVQLAGATTRPVPIRAFVSRALVALSQGAALELGDVRAGVAITKTFSVTNTGNLASNVSVFGQSGAAVSPASVQVAPAASRTVTLTVTPQGAIGSTFETYVGANGSGTCQPQQGFFVRGRIVAP